MMISLGAIIYLNCTNKIVSAFLFSIGLISVMVCEFELYTGIVGFAKPKDIFKVAKVLVGNIIGSLLILIIPTSGADILMQNKLNTPLYFVFGKAIICGIIIYICVLAFRKNNILITLLGVPTFILCGAEHSIADICFVVASKMFNLEVLLFLVVVIIGNAVGAIGLNFICNLKTRSE